MHPAITQLTAAADVLVQRWYQVDLLVEALDRAGVPPGDVVERVERVLRERQRLRRLTARGGQR